MFAGFISYNRAVRDSRRTFSFDSPSPEDLWSWLADYEEKTGGKVLAIPHNGNLSNGLMFAPNRADGSRIDEDYATRRARWEPLTEVTQIKGDGEAHPFLSPDDDFADFGTWDRGDIGVLRPRPATCCNMNMPDRPSEMD